MKDEYVLATYDVIDKEENLRKRAEGIAIGLTVGSWTDLPATKQASLKEHCGAVGDIEVTEKRGDGSVSARIDILYPVRNFTPHVPAILTTVFGKLSMDGEIRLVHLAIPDTLLRGFPGPKFGIEGMRKSLGVEGRPLIMSIFKSCVGQTLEELTANFESQALGQVDLVKDDEIFFTEEYATPEQRVSAYAEVSRRVAEKTGRYVRYAVNLTGPTFSLRDRARRLAELGAGALLLNVFAYGYDVLQELASDPDVPIPLIAHPAVSGTYFAPPHHGISADVALGILLRAAGADVVLYPAAYGSVTMKAHEAERLVEALRRESIHPRVWPGPSAGVHPGMVKRLMDELGSDFIVNAGGGIHGHPSGAAAGGRAMLSAVEAAVKGQDLREAAADNPELAQALSRWGVVE